LMRNWHIGCVPAFQAG